MKMTSILAALVLMLAGPAFALDVTLDTQSAKAVLKALKNSALTRSEALAVAALPGNQGLIRKAVSYKIAATTETFADALVASAHGAPLFDGKGNGGRGRGLRRQDDLKTIAGKDFRSDLGEAVGKESAVIADHHPGRPPKNRRCPIPDLRFPKAGGGLRDPGDIGEGELLRNDRAPAVGAEVDACHF